MITAEEVTEITLEALRVTTKKEIEDILEEVSNRAKYGWSCYRTNIISGYAIVELKKLGFEVSEPEIRSELRFISWGHLKPTDLKIIDTIKS